MIQKIKYSRLKLMAEVQCWAIWDMDGVDNIDPLSLPLSYSLANEINRWSDIFDDTYNLNNPNFHLETGFTSKIDSDHFYDQGWELLNKLKHEMPEIEWWYRDMRLNKLAQSNITQAHENT